MFTGIIRAVGIVEVAASGPHSHLVVRSRRRLTARAGDSVAVHGVCLTVTRTHRGRLHFDMVEETRRATTLGHYRAGARVNLESALVVGDSVGGHWVLGHVDGVGRVVGRRQTPTGVSLTIAPPAFLRRFLAPKGAITVDGVSLTVGPGITRGAFTVHLVPYTLGHTTLGALRRGDRVNLEVDPLARYVVAAIDGRR